ncbi:MAG: hypothetical protein WAL15_06135 [Xanthobacteraceae bacterium]
MSVADTHGTAWVNPSTKPQPSIAIMMITTMRRAKAGLAMLRIAVADPVVPIASSVEPANRTAPR